MGVKYSNNAKTTLSANVSTSATSVSVASSSGFPSLSGGDYFYATMVQQSDDTALEIVKVTAVSGTTWTVSRAQDNTSAGSFASGDKIELRASAGVFIDLFAEKAPTANPTFTGNITIGNAEISETELEILDGATVTTAELNKLDGTTATTASLTYGKDLYDTGVTATEFDYLDGVSANIQTQITAKMSEPSGFARGSVIIGDSSGNPANLGIGANGYVLKSDGTDIAWAEDEKTTTTNFVKNSFTGDNTTAGFTLSQAPNSEDNLIVFIEGVFQNQGDYTLSGSTLTFDDPPATGRKIVAYHVKAAVSGANLNHDQFTCNGNSSGNLGTEFTLSITPINENNTQVFIDGVYQQKTDYSISGTTLTMDTAPASGAILEVMTFTQTEINVPTAGSVVTASIANDVNLNGNPTTTTQSAGNNTTRIATTAFVETAVSNLIDSAPGTMNTLNEIAAALGDDPAFTTTVNNAIATKAPLASPTFTGDLTMPSKLIHASDTDTYMKFDPNQIGFVTGNSTRFQIQTSLVRFNQEGIDQDFQIEGDNEENLFYVDASTDKIGIGTDSPTKRLTISGEDCEVLLNRTGSYADTINFGMPGGVPTMVGGTDLAFGGTGTWTEHMRIKASGKIGIGTDTPLDLLHLNSSSGDVRMLMNAPTDSDAEIKFAENGTIKYTIGHDAGTDAFVIGTDNVDTNRRFVVNSSGNIGINTASPNNLLHIYAGNSGSTLTDARYKAIIEHSSEAYLAFGSSANSFAGVRFVAPSGQKGYIDYYHGTQGDKLVYSATSSHEWKKGATTYMALSAGGNLGVGTASPSHNLHIKNTAAEDTGIIIENTNNAQNLDIDYWNNVGAVQGRIRYAEGAGSFSFYPNTSASSALTILDDGKVGIGNDSPVAFLDIRKDNDNSGNQLLLADTEGASPAVRTYSTSDPEGLIINHYYALSGSGNEYRRYSDFVSNVSSGGGTTMRFITKNAANTYTVGLVLDNNGKVGIGTTSPTVPLTVNNSTDHSDIAIFHAGGGTPDRGLKVSTFSNTNSNAGVELDAQHSTGAFKFSTGGTERMRIDSTGYSKITTNSDTDYSSTGEPAGILTLYNSNGSDGAGANNYSSLEFNTGDGATSQGFINYIRTADNQGKFTFSQRTGSSSYAEALTILNDGKVGIGTASPNAKLEISGKDDAAGTTDLLRLQFDNSPADTGITFTDINSTIKNRITMDAANTADLRISSGTQIDFYTNTTNGTSSPTMRIANGGQVIVGDTTTYSGGHDAVSRLQLSGGGSVLAIRQTQVTDGSHRVVTVFTDNSGTYRGRITINNSACSFTSASDYRLKENIEPLPNGLDRLKQLNPVKFKWKEHDYTSEGFIAHEVQEIYPEAVVGEKDDEVMQSMDYGKITPLLVKAIQEQQTIIDDLKARIETLEG